MSIKFKFIELNYYYHGEFTTPEEAINRHRPSNLFVLHLTRTADTILIKHLNYSGSHSANGIRYRFFRSRNRFFHIPSETHRFVRDEKPDMVLVQGLIFPLQVIALRKMLGKHCKIVLQHHGEPPFRWKRIFQRIADRYVDAYIFTSIGNAREWLETGVIRDNRKCYEIIPSSTEFSRQDKLLSRQKTGMKGEKIFLWVGRLNENKDPVTVLKGFEKYSRDHPADRLYMIYGEDDILKQVKEIIVNSPILPGRVELIGKTAHPELVHWYSAADYFISGSHHEGGSYALTEAMACGCVPIVTNIPASMKAIDDGEAGYYYEAGNSEALYNVLSGLPLEQPDEMSNRVEKQFAINFSPAAIADKFIAVYQDLKSGSAAN